MTPEQQFVQTGEREARDKAWELYQSEQDDREPWVYGHEFNAGWQAALAYSAGRKGELERELGEEREMNAVEREMNAVLNRNAVKNLVALNNSEALLRAREQEIERLRTAIQEAIDIIPGSMGGHVTLGLNILQKAARCARSWRKR